MPDIKKIVVPVDLDKNTDKLVDYAVNMARFLDAEIALYHAVEFVTIGEMALGSISYEDLNDSRKQSAEKQLNEIETNIRSQCKKCTSHVSIGDTVDGILSFAEKEHADMIIMGTHGKRGLEKILLGSVAERVVKNAHCPVLIMNPYK